MKKDKLVNAFFLIPLFGLTVLSFLLPQNGFSELENRYLSKKPKFTWESVVSGEYGTSYETWLSDQFPFRTMFVAVRTAAKRAVLQQDINGVYFGEDHYYIEKHNTEDLMTEQMAKNIDYLAQASVWFADTLDGRVSVMLVPSASQILTDKLPPFAAPADQTAVTEALRGILEQDSAEDIQILPIEQRLKEHEREPLYYKTDHHWTTLGAYYAYQLYAENAGFTPKPREEFAEHTVSGTFQGTIQARLGIPLENDNINLFLPREESQVEIYYDGLLQTYDSFYDETALKKRDQYAVFLGGNHGWTKIVSKQLGEDSQAAGRKLLIVHDSYANSFVPFLAGHFEEIHMVDLRYFNPSLSEFAKTQEITDLLVLYQIPGFAKDGNLFKIVR